MQGLAAASLGMSSYHQVMSEAARKGSPTAGPSPVEEAELPRPHDGLISR
jgi:hypothetical protein